MINRFPAQPRWQGTLGGWGVAFGPTASLAAGTATLVQVGSAAVTVTATDATRGTPPYTYQWQISLNGGTTWSNAAGLNITSRSAIIQRPPSLPPVTARLQYRDAASNTAYSNTLSATTVAGPRWFPGLGCRRTARDDGTLSDQAQALVALLLQAGIR
jgi:hypothetical protein